MKTVTEWLNQFNLYWNNIASDKAPGLNEYEISVFCTDAQDSVTVAVYKGQLGNGFEATEEVRAYLDTLVKQDEKLPFLKPGMTPEAGQYVLDSERSYLFRTPTDMLFRTWESCKILTGCGDTENGNVTPVIPVTQDDYWRAKDNPYRGPSKKRVLRVNYAKAEVNGESQLSVSGTTELISKYEIKSYQVRYLAQPDPIILTDLSSMDLSIHGQNTIQTCKLPEALHPLILAEAVRLAKAAWNI